MNTEERRRIQAVKAGGDANRELVASNKELLKKVADLEATVERQNQMINALQLRMANIAENPSLIVRNGRNQPKV